MAAHHSTSALDTSGLDAKRLTLEITESVLVQDPDIAGARLQSLRELGVRLALDVLVGLGCDIIQGHVLARPLEATAAAAWASSAQRLSRSSESELMQYR